MIQAVNARELHAFLKVGRDFSTRVQELIGEYHFVEGMDYSVVETLISPTSGSAKARPQRLKEYHLVINIAKELAMIERNEEGRRARRYFIDSEELLALVVPELQVMAANLWQGERELTKD